MSWKCEKCGQTLKGREKFCPERAEKRGEALKKAGGTVASVGSIAVAVVTRGKFRGGKS